MWFRILAIFCLEDFLRFLLVLGRNEKAAISLDCLALPYTHKHHTGNKTKKKTKKKMTLKNTHWQTIREH
jgi:hypothetical protein